MKQPLVTIAISCYNHEKYIRDAILSALNQTYANIELLIFDDGSSDNSISIISNLQKEYGFFFQEQANQGLAKTLNKALAMAKGKYFAPFGSDDIMMLDKVEKQVSYMETNSDLPLCGGNTLLIDENGTLLNTQRLNPSTRQNFKALFFGIGPGLPAPTMFFKTSSLRAAGGFNPEIPLEDLYIQLKLTRDGGEVGLLNDVLAYYRTHPNNTYKNLEYMLKNVLKTFDYFNNEPGYEQVRSNFLNSMLLRASKRDTALARRILSMIPLKNYNMKTIRALPRIALTNRKT